MITTGEIVSLVTRQRELNFPPGSSHLYSNTAYTVLALIVEAVTGRSLRRFAEDEIFRPLGMALTLFLEDFHRIVANRADSYSPRAEGGYLRRNLSYCTVGATSLNTTVPDLARWAAMR